MSQPISPEFKLLCGLLPVHFRGELPWPDSWSGVDPAAFYAYVLKTQVAPLALHHWETRCPALWDDTPFEIRARLVAWLELFHHKQMARFASWRELLSAFAAADLPVIPLKGFVLSRHLYGDPFRRNSSDFDCLIQPADRERARRLLLELGFACVIEGGPRLAHGACWHKAGAAPDGGVNLDLHWAIRPAWHFIALDERRLWERSAPAETTGVPHRMLAPLDTALVALIMNVSDYGHANLRGCVEAMECVARLDAADRAELVRCLRRGASLRILAALETLRLAACPGSDAGWLPTDAAPLPRLRWRDHFTAERFYLEPAPYTRRAMIHLHLANRRRLVPSLFPRLVADGRGRLAARLARHS